MAASSTSLFFGSSTAIVAPSKAQVGRSVSSARMGSGQVICMASGKQQEASVGRRKAMNLALALVLGGALAQASSADKANAGLVEELLEKSAANKELNDKKRLATSYANTARAYTVSFGTCKFPENFTGCQDLAKKKNVPFLTDDLKIECEGKEKYKCAANVFWKW
ncbi:hypothetical protein KP509_07G046800 [Ceratopteris richardii]|uniref:Photosystem I reaction center subunit N, chloroplastic n=1 Tax=Ceratopteris richardii TaxID=49495 RepID=A0A8T2UGG6_CERRI|nr:hypothetical protein KP509_07G046800 [Ceratopteris richardii]